MQLHPAGTQLSNVLVQRSAIAPDFNEFFIGLNRVIPASVKGLPASSRFLDDTAQRCSGSSIRSCATSTRSSSTSAMFKREIAAMFANDTAVTQATDQIGQDRVHYLRLTEPGEPGGAVRTTRNARAGTAATPYTQPGAYDQLQGRPAGVRTRPAASRTAFPTLGPPDGQPCPRSCATGIILYVLNSGNTVAPPCRKQAPFTVGGQTTRLPAGHRGAEAEPVAALIDSRVDGYANPR